MNRIARAFQGGIAFIPFITAGDPNLSITEELAVQMADAGADLIELGVPFTDPVAEGIVIQKADQRALAAGTTTDKLFDTVSRIRRRTDVPLVFMTYINPVYAYGAERFFERCRDTGIDGIIVPDMPFDEKAEILDTCKAYGITLISMIAPTSRDRIRTIAAEAEGFLYCVSSLGVTGVRSEITTDLGGMIRAAKSVTDIPCAVGFGVSTPEQARDIGKDADGVIVGSAIVRIIEEHGTACIAPVVDYVKAMKAAVK